MTEEKIVKIVDETTHTRGASVERVALQGALIVKAVGTTVTLDPTGSGLVVESIPLAHEGLLDDISTGIASIPNVTQQVADELVDGTQKTQIVDSIGTVIETFGSETVKIQETIPTDLTKLNAPTVLAYDGYGNLSTVTITVSGVSYQQTLTYNGDYFLISISNWVEI